MRTRDLGGRRLLFGFCGQGRLLRESDRSWDPDDKTQSCEPLKEVRVVHLRRCRGASGFGVFQKQKEGPCGSGPVTSGREIRTRSCLTWRPTRGMDFILCEWDMILFASLPKEYQTWVILWAKMLRPHPTRPCFHHLSLYACSYLNRRMAELNFEAYKGNQRNI